MRNQIHAPGTHFTHIPGSRNGFGSCVFIRNDIANLLDKFARSGNCYKLSLVKTLQGLTAGHDHQDNILQAVHTGNETRVFSIELPGCLAQVLYNPDGNYYVYNIVSREEGNREVKKTGLYLSRKSTSSTNYRSSWEAEFKENFKPAHGSTQVVVTDASEVSADAAKKAASALSSSDYVASAVFNQFYLHHTHGEKKITGYFRRKSITQPLSIKETRDSAKLLANTMMQARTESQKSRPDERQPTEWVSSRGGSAVLTQALAILKNQGISFHGHNHHIFFHEIASDADQALILALDLGFKMPSKPFTKRLGLTSLAVGGHSGINHRVKAEARYTRSRAALDHAANFLAPTIGIFVAAYLLTPNVA